MTATASPPARGALPPPDPDPGRPDEWVVELMIPTGDSSSVCHVRKVFR